MSTVYESLIKRLDPAVRTIIQRRTEAMMRQIDYLEEQKDDRLVFLRSKGWTRDRLNIICSLNSFYQVVVGPLASSARRGARVGLGREIPIHYGDEITFDTERSDQINGMYRAFLGIVRTTGLPDRFLHANRADDLIFQLWRYLHAPAGD